MGTTMKIHEVKFYLLPMVENILESSGVIVVPDAMSLAHYKDTLRGIWWYHLQTRTLSYSNKASSHMDFSKFPEVKNLHGWIRGRVFEDDKRFYIIVYLEDFKVNISRVSGDILHDMYRKISSASNYTIHDIVDEEGQSLVPN